MEPSTSRIENSPICANAILLDIIISSIVVSMLAPLFLNYGSTNTGALATSSLVIIRNIYAGEETVRKCGLRFLFSTISQDKPLSAVVSHRTFTPVFSKDCASYIPR